LFEERLISGFKSEGRKFNPVRLEIDIIYKWLTEAAKTPSGNEAGAFLEMAFICSGI